MGARSLNYKQPFVLYNAAWKCPYSEFLSPRFIYNFQKQLHSGVKNVYCKISQNSQEIPYIGEPFWKKLVGCQFYQNKAPAQVFLDEFSEQPLREHA